TCRSLTLKKTSSGPSKASTRPSRPWPATTPMPARRAESMAERWQDEQWAKSESLWYSGKTSRRRFLGFGAAAAGALGATVAVPAWWRSAFGQAKAYKIGTMQPLSGTAAAGGKTAPGGTPMAVGHINKTGGIQRPPHPAVTPHLPTQARPGAAQAQQAP